MEESLRASIDKAISDLREINLRIAKYNQDLEEDENLEDFLDNEQKRLIKYLTVNTFGSNVTVLRN